MSEDEVPVSISVLVVPYRDAVFGLWKEYDDGFTYRLWRTEGVALAEGARPPDVVTIRGEVEPTDEIAALLAGCRELGFEHSTPETIRRFLPLAPEARFLCFAHCEMPALERPRRVWGITLEACTGTDGYRDLVSSSLTLELPLVEPIGPWRGARLFVSGDGQRLTDLEVRFLRLARPEYGVHLSGFRLPAAVLRAVLAMGCGDVSFHECVLPDRIGDLSPAPHVKHLSIHGGIVQTNVVVRLLAACSQVEHLDYTQQWLDERTMTAIAGLTELTHLELTWAMVDCNAFPLHPSVEWVQVPHATLDAPVDWRSAFPNAEIIGL